MTRRKFLPLLVTAAAVAPNLVSLAYAQEQKESAEEQKLREKLYELVTELYQLANGKTLEVKKLYKSADGRPEQWELGVYPVMGKPEESRLVFKKFYLDTELEQPKPKITSLPDEKYILKGQSSPWSKDGNVCSTEKLDENKISSECTKILGPYLEAMLAEAKKTKK